MGLTEKGSGACAQEGKGEKGRARADFSAISEAIPRCKMSSLGGEGAGNGVLHRRRRSRSSKN